jgi:hypothetical protein
MVGQSKTPTYFDSGPVFQDEEGLITTWAQKDIKTEFRVNARE